MVFKLHLHPTLKEKVKGVDIILSVKISENTNVVEYIFKLDKSS